MAEVMTHQQPVVLPDEAFLGHAVIGGHHGLDVVDRVQHDGEVGQVAALAVRRTVPRAADSNMMGDRNVRRVVRCGAVCCGVVYCRQKPSNAVMHRGQPGTDVIKESATSPRWLASGHLMRLMVMWCGQGGPARPAHGCDYVTDDGERACSECVACLMGREGGRHASPGQSSLAAP